MSTHKVSPFQYVNKSNIQQAAEHLDRYLRTFTGRLFESLADDDRTRFTANDIIAVSALSVDVPAEAAARIIDDSDSALTDLIATLSVLSISDPIAQWEKPLTTLWQSLKDHHQIGGVIASKLIATKLPGLIPIYDQHVADGLGFGDASYWVEWHEAMSTGPQVEALNAAIETLRSDFAGAEHLSPLRILDIAIWMEQHGCGNGHAHPLRREKV